MEKTFREGELKDMEESYIGSRGRVSEEEGRTNTEFWRLGEAGSILGTARKLRLLEHCERTVA